MADKLHENRELVAGGLVFHRKQAGSDAIGRVETSASGRGFLVGVSLKAGHRRRIFSGSRSTLHDFEEGTLYIRDFSDDYRADLYGSFDFLLIEVPHLFVARMSDERGGRELRDFNCGAGLADPILSHLARAVMPALDSPANASPLLLEQLGIAIGTRLYEQHGQAQPENLRPRAGLSRVHEALAKDMLLSQGDSPNTIADIAKACRVSRSHLIHAFRETTGIPPHRWLMNQRVEQARSLLSNTQLSLADIAAECGFSDQSHFSRAFSKAQGMPPGAWRRRLPP